MAPKSASSRPIASPLAGVPARKPAKAARQVASKPVTKQGRTATSGKRAVAVLKSSKVEPLTANTARSEVGRQLRAIGTTQTRARATSDTLGAVRAYAREVFGCVAKANRWFERPSVRLNGERPIVWLQNHSNPTDVYAALDAIAYGTPL
ncbi:DUF2384 domain-containing protein [Burkholderia cepacia]|nr:DUF2384 domain-containing protein [Burkholderia cepacia]